jgi:hypothetical protein
MTQLHLFMFTFWPDSTSVHVMARPIDLNEPQAWGYAADTEGNGGMPLVISVALYPATDDYDWAPVLAGVENQFRAMLGRDPEPWVPNSDARNMVTALVSSTGHPA